MHKTKVTTPSSAAMGTPATARPMPARAACTIAVTTTPSATPRMACAASRTTRSPGSPARCRPKRSSPSAALSPFAYMTAAMASVSRNCKSNQPRLRSVPAIQATAVAAYGAAAEARSPSGLAAIVCQASTACVPTMGSVPSHSGGGGMVNDRTLAAHSTISPALETIVPVASDSGRTSTSSHVAVMAATARFRLPQSHACSRRITGHVATTIIEAQMIAPRKGRRIQTVDAISATMNRTPRVARGRSGRGSMTCVSRHPPSPRHRRTSLAVCQNTAPQQTFHQLFERDHRQQKWQQRGERDDPQLKDRLLRERHEPHGPDHVEAVGQVGKRLDVGAADERFVRVAVAAYPLRVELSDVALRKHAVLAEARALGACELSRKHHERARAPRTRVRRLSPIISTVNCGSVAPAKKMRSAIMPASRTPCARSSGANA